MKYSTLLLFFFFVLFNTPFISGQCDFEKGDFEEWSYEDFELGDEVLQDTLFIPQETTPFLRLFIIGVELLFTDLFEGIESPEQFTEQLFGMARSEDASSGMYALKLGGNDVAPLADMATFGQCGNEVDQFKFDYKHIGEGSDTVTFITAIFDSPENFDLNDTEDMENYYAFATGNFVVSGTQDEYQEYSITLTKGNPEISPDSLFIWILVASDYVSGESSEPSYLLLDNIRFEGMTSSLDDNVTDNADIHIFPTIAYDRINIENSGQPFQQYQIINMDGKLSAKGNFSAFQEYIDVIDLPRGQYILQLMSNNGLESKRFYKF